MGRVNLSRSFVDDQTFIRLRAAAIGRRSTLRLRVRCVWTATVRKRNRVSARLTDPILAAARPTSTWQGHSRRAAPTATNRWLGARRLRARRNAPLDL